MRVFLRCCFLVGLLSLVTACASMSEQECLTANWLDQGYRDGARGEPLSRLADHGEACAKVGVYPDATLYHKGRDQGILEYCRPYSALQQGRLGNYYKNACPAHLERQFLRYYNEGKRVYEAEKEVSDLTSRSQQLERDLAKEKDETQRQALRQRLRLLDRQVQRARDNVRFLDRQLESSLRFY